MMAECIFLKLHQWLLFFAQAYHPVTLQEDISYELEDSIDCLNNQLKFIKLIGLVEPGTNLNFAKFLIAKAQKLKVMTLVREAGWREKWEEESRCQLCLENIASLDAQVIFMKEPFSYFYGSTWGPAFR